MRLALQHALCLGHGGLADGHSAERAAVLYGPPEVLELTELPTPVPARDEVLVRVLATTVSSADWRLRSLQLPAGFGPLGRLAFGIRAPRKAVLGTEFCGRVQALGPDVTQFKVGDEVVAYPGARLGAHAEFCCAAAAGPIARKPSNLSHEQAAALCFGGATMLDFFRRAALRGGEHVLVNGACGTVGSAAVQLARHVGAHVTAVCSSANVEWVRSIGADHVIDYSRDDFSLGGKTYDVVVDTAGTAPFNRSRRVLTEGGRLLLVSATLAEMLRAPWVNLTSHFKVIAGPTAERPEYVHELVRLAEAGHFLPVIDRCYPFAQMRDAHRYVDLGHKRGSVVVCLEDRLA